jgi:23S rRNA (uracil1939-C5)-methyltransferase
MEAAAPRARAVLGAPHVEYRRGTLDAPRKYAAFLSPGGFMQASREGNLLLTTHVVESVKSLGLPAGARVLELFAGNGNFTLPIAAMDLDVRACDGDARAIENARLAAAQCAGELSRLPTFEVADAADLTRRLAAKSTRVDVVILDPPRIGARAACEAMSSLAPRAVVYVSCDAATLARDAAILGRAGFILERAEPLALFPQSAHFETVALFRR